jgi:predicted RNase H-like HicB family nuclease
VDWSTLVRSLIQQSNNVPAQTFRVRKETFMKLNIVYKKEKDWFIGHIQEYPDYESQGKTIDELRENLIEIYHDINKGLVPDAEPFQLLEVAI